MRASFASSNSSNNTAKTKVAAAALAVIRGKENNQVGADFDRAHQHRPFFWFLLFISGSTNSIFLLEAASKGIKQIHDCFSALDHLSCSAAIAIATPPNPSWLTGVAVAVRAAWRE